MNISDMHTNGKVNRHTGGLETILNVLHKQQGVNRHTGGLETELESILEELRR